MEKSFFKIMINSIKLRIGSNNPYIKCELIIVSHNCHFICLINHTWLLIWHLVIKSILSSEFWPHSWESKSLQISIILFTYTKKKKKKLNDENWYTVESWMCTSKLLNSANTNIVQLVKIYISEQKIRAFEISTPHIIVLKKITKLLKLGPTILNSFVGGCSWTRLTLKGSKCN